MQCHLHLQNSHKISLSGLTTDKMDWQAGCTSENSYAEAMFTGTRIV